MQISLLSIRIWNVADHIVFVNGIILKKVFALVKPLSGGDYAIGMFNFSDQTSEMSLQFFDIGLPTSSGRGLKLYDCHAHTTIGTFTERYAAQIPSHDCLVFRAKVVKR